jgi:hypothetical protein
MEVPNIKRESGISRIAGATPEEEKDILKQFSEVSRCQEAIEFEREKTHDEIELVERIIEMVPKFVRAYGGQAPEIRVRNIHFVDASTLPRRARLEMRMRPGERGRYDADRQSITIFTDGTVLKDTQAVIHEILHFCGFESYTKRGDALVRRRGGLTMLSRDGKHMYLNDLNEAIIEELTKRFDELYFPLVPELQEALEERRRIREKHTHQAASELASVVTTPSASGGWQVRIDGYAYPRERENLWRLIDELVKRNADQFGSREEGFRLLAKASFNGRLLDVIRGIDQGFGRGAFVRFAKRTKQTLTPKH